MRVMWFELGRFQTLPLGRGVRLILILTVIPQPHPRCHLRPTQECSLDRGARRWRGRSRRPRSRTCHSPPRHLPLKAAQVSSASFTPTLSKPQLHPHPHLHPHHYSPQACAPWLGCSPLRDSCRPLRACPRFQPAPRFPCTRVRVHRRRRSCLHRECS